ncbi:SDR family NAD(P)-dependent oxidoreductase, partial [Kitasatospora purpeofusca]|uniref:SDR family NAD(P)-dependent oxidoreductase n=1 Tax=Kitasatospora purpeofusca TaxID=67352 RepID=UPI0035DE7C3B
ALRSRAIKVLAGRGGMASLPLPVDAVRERLASWVGRLSVAAVNGPSSTVVSGDADAVVELVDVLVSEGVRARLIDVDYASHSSHVEEIREQVLADLDGIVPRSGSVPFYSSVTGGLLDTKALDAGYWYRNLRETVEFERATRELLAAGHRVFVESSPHPVLGVAVGESVEAAGADAAVLGTLRREEGGPEQMLRAVGRGWECGLEVDWSGAFPGARRVDLPTYAFQRRRYWLTAPAAVPAAPAEDRWDDLELQDPAQLAETLGVGREALDEVLPALTAWRSVRKRERKAESWRYHVAWAPLSVAPADGLPGRWLALRPERDDAAAVLDTLGEAGADLLPCVVADPGATREQLAALLTTTAGEQPIAGVLSLLSWEERSHPGHPDLPGGPALTLALIQALEDTGLDARLWTLTKGTAVLGGAERPGHVGQAASAALGRTLALEHPHRRGGLIDLPEVLDLRAARRLCAVLAGAVADEEQVVVRSTGVHGRRLRPASPVHPASPVPPKDRKRGADGADGGAVPERTRPRWQGTVLVTGGTGGVGSHTARWLAGQGAERLLLVGRRGADAPGTDELRAELTALGTEVAFAACDVADPAALAALVAGIPAQHPLSAVFHAAGVLDDGVLDALDPARLAVVLRAKLTAARNLHEATAGLDLSAFVVFSSVMGVVGNAGQGNYAAANAAVDALVASRRAVGLPGTSVAWGAWAGPGLLADDVAARLRDSGMPVMEPETAVTAIGRALAEDDTLVVVADVDWRRFTTGMGPWSAALLDGIPDPAAARPVQDTAAPSAAREGGGSADVLRQRIAVLPRHEDRVRTLTELVRTHAATVLRHPDVDTVQPGKAFSALGFDSLTAVELRNRLAAATGLALPATVLFDHPTASALADRLLADLDLSLPHAASVTTGSVGAVGSLGAGAVRSAEPGSNEPIAIVGMGCRFPGGVVRPEDFWHLLSKGTDAVGDWPSNRGWDTEGLYDPDPDRAGTTYSRQGGFLHDAPEFDAEFFGISPREALAMDPQQRLLLETAWEAVEGAGQDPTALKDRQVGVYIGTNGQDYSALLEGAEGVSEGHLLTGNTASVLSGRLSYVLGLQGPSLTVDTACSSSLVALHLAVQALRRGDCEQALAGGVTVMSTPRLFVEFSRQRGLAADGRCKAFSAEADGTGWGEGAGVLLLERHSDALRHGHPVLALISGTAVNQDGASNGLTAPNGPSQQQVIRAALADAALRADQIDAIEAHGTGTRLGDPIEAQALQAVHGPERPADRPLWLGSVKSNIGHTQAAAGVAGVMKMVLAIRHGELPGTLHAGTPNPHVDWSGGGIRLLASQTPWPETGSPRRAGVSSFGISGTNAHVIVEQAPAIAVVPAPDRTGAPDPTAGPDRTGAAAGPAPDAAATTAVAAVTAGATATPTARRTGPPVPLLLSAGTPEALRAQAGRLVGRLDADPDVELADVAYSLATGRAPLEHRAAVLGRDRESVRHALTALARGTAAGRLLTGGAVRSGRTAFLFPGQGSQRAGAGAELYREDPVFADALDEVLTALDPHLDLGLRDVLFAVPGTPGAELLDRTRYTQPALFALGTALFRLVRHWGVRPDLLMGHSIGELTAAHVAGVLDLPDACALVAARGRLMDELPEGGAMVAVEATEEEVRRALLDDRAGHPVPEREADLGRNTGRDAGRDAVDVAAVNGPTSVVLSGDADAVQRLAGAFRSRGRRTRRLSVSHAFHSARMDGMLDAFRDVAESLTYHAPGIEIVSNLTGRTATAAELRSPDHWVRHVRGTVRFLEGARRLRAEGATTYLELGPGGVLSGMLHACLPDPTSDPASDSGSGSTSGSGSAPGGAGTVPLLRDGRGESDAVRTALASLHLRGVAVDWSAGWSGTDVRRVDLPTYAFQRRRFWPEAALDPAPAAWRSRRGTAVPAVPAGPRRYRIAWEPLTGPAQPALSGRWLLVTPDGPGAEDTALACEQALAGHGADVVVIRVGAAVERNELALLLPEFGALEGVLSLLALAEGPHPDLRTLDAGLTGTLLLLQALGDSGIDAPLWCATRGAVAARGTEEVRPEQAQVWGLGRVAALEHPQRWGGLVDLPDLLDGPALDGLCAVLAGRDGEDQVAVRGPEALGRRLVHAAEPATPAPAPWTPRGTVLVTGGTGGLGAQVARWLAERGAEHLVLLGRRGPEAPGADALADALAALGARSTLLACDVADRAALERVLERLDDEGDTVRAVVHAAGLTSDTALTDCTPEELALRTAAKARGAAHLDALFEGRPLDAFVLFSSISATWGSGGQGAYAAANAYLDGLAAARRGRGLTATSVAWGPWAGAGMADGAVGDGLRRHGLVPMEPAAALSALGLVLALDEGEAVVAELDRARFVPTFGSVRDSALLRGLPSAAESRAADGGPAAADGSAGSGTGTGGDPSLLQRLRRLSGPEGRKLLTELVRSEAAVVLGHDPAAGFVADRPFREAGFDSLTAVELRNRLVAATALPLALTSVFDHPTAAALGAHLFAGLSGAEPDGDSTTGTTGTTARDSAAGPAAADEPLAIVSMACRFPGGVRSPEDLWRLVADGVDAVAALPADRGWPLDTLYDPDPLHPGTFYTEGGGFLDGAAEFDAEFFGISPREALAMDPQQRLLLETSWEALERAGLDPASVRGSEGGVYVGVAAQGYGTGPQDPSDEVEGHLLSGTVTSVASGRIAYTLGLGGPAVTVETACSSSLVALHLAGQALRAGDCSFALVGGAAVMASPDVFVEFSRQQGLSPDGRCRSFAEGANGTGWGEGVGVLLVERLSDARRLGHPVLALVRGTAVNQDGATNGLTAPSGPAQQRVIRAALATAGLSGADIDLVEAHGTGTVLGDPIEAQALLATYGQDRPAERPLWLGSLKSNIGHTQAAAGVAGVIKTVLALRNGVLPATLHAQEASSRVDWSAGAVRLLAEARPWDTPDGDRPRRAGVSAFGMSGTNAHAVLEEAPAPDEAALPEGTYGEPSEDTGATVPWLLSATTPAALRRQARRLGEHLRADPDGGAAGPARALATTRPALAFRAAATGRDRDALLGWLDALAAGEPAPDAVQDRARGGRTVFVFPGQGSQWVGMAAAALDTSPAFAAAVDACERALAPHTDWSLTEVLRGAPGAPTLDRVDVVQPVLFAVMVALAAHWRATGVTPDAVVGHSQGEIAAACVAGALSLDDAALVVALRSRALLRLAGRGGMVSVAASAERTTSLLPAGGRVCVAAVNGPGAVVVAGEPQELAALLAACEREGVRARTIPVDYAAHSAQVAEIEDELREALTGIRPRAAAVPIYSTVTGEPVAGESLDAAYWYRNLREPVDFVGATRALLDAGHTLAVEVSPHPVLLAGIEAVAAEAGREVSAVGTLRRGDGGRDRLLASLTEAWAAGGGPVDWSPWTGDPGPGGPAALLLPTYPFQRDRYWLPTPGRTAAAVTTPVTTSVPAEGTARAAGDDDGTPAVRLAARLAPLDRRARRQAVLDLVVRHAAAVLGHPGAGPVRPERAFSEVGFDSMLAVRFRNALCEATGLTVPPTVVFDHPTPEALADYLDAELSAAPEPPSPLLAELDRLAALLAAVPPGAADTDGVGERLDELQRGWGRRAGAPGGEALPPGPVDDLAAATETATADELFALIDNDFGNA